MLAFYISIGINILTIIISVRRQLIMRKHIHKLYKENKLLASMLGLIKEEEK